MVNGNETIADLLAIHERNQKELDDALDSAEAVLVAPGDLAARSWADQCWAELRALTLTHIDEEEKRVFVHGANLGITEKQLAQFVRAHDRLRQLAAQLDRSSFVEAAGTNAVTLAEALDLFVHVYVTHADREERVFSALRRVDTAHGSHA